MVAGPKYIPFSIAGVCCVFKHRRTVLLVVKSTVACTRAGVSLDFSTAPSSCLRVLGHADSGAEVGFWQACRSGLRHCAVILISFGDCMRGSYVLLNPIKWCANIPSVLPWDIWKHPLYILSFYLRYGAQNRVLSISSAVVACRGRLPY